MRALHQGGWPETQPLSWLRQLSTRKSRVDPRANTIQAQSRVKTLEQLKKTRDHLMARVMRRQGRQGLGGSYLEESKPSNPPIGDAKKTLEGELP
jgi:hypothetical protein